ncbi:hypothetical protein [Rubrivirga sp.]|uniref:hypothetical protein n=1 Tax=Rubrivirga sp. TaxID=1885344 RepID=UPI003B528D34
MPAPQAQNVVEVLQRQRRDARLAEVMAEQGPRLEPRPVVEAGEVDRWTRAFRAVEAARQAARDSLVAAENARADSVIRLAQLATLRWRKVEPDAQGSFLEQYRETYWQAAAPDRNLLVDTSRTALLRGRLQAAFGRPTRNGDALRRHGYGGSEFVQFEYWFVVNDSIPVLALDIDGPFGNGLMVASDERYTSLLPPIRADLSARLEAAGRPDPWLDYYHSFERRQWYRTGFNGADHFVVEVRPPRWSGRSDTDRWIIHR